MQRIAAYRHVRDATAFVRLLTACVAVSIAPALPAADLADPEYADSAGDALLPTWLPVGAGLPGAAASVAYTVQRGVDNHADIFQVGSGHQARILQSGDGNRAELVQHGTAHHATIDQQGNGNAFSLTQSGTGQHLDVLQWGDGLSVQAAQR